MACDDRKLTMVEKRNFLEQMQALIKTDVLTRDDQREIYFIGLAAYKREMAKIAKED